MKEKERSCSVAIHCYNEEQHIGHLLTGVMQQTVWDVEVIVVDSGSTAATLSIASRYPSANSLHPYRKHLERERRLKLWESG